MYHLDWYGYILCHQLKFCKSLHGNICLGIYLQNIFGIYISTINLKDNLLLNKMIQTLFAYIVCKNQRKKLFLRFHYGSLKAKPERFFPIFHLLILISMVYLYNNILSFCLNIYCSTRFFSFQMEDFKTSITLSCSFSQSLKR